MAALYHPVLNGVPPRFAIQLCNGMITSSPGDSMTRKPLKLHLKKGQLHDDVGKAPGDKITEADIAEEKAKGGVFAQRAQFAENARTWRHPIKGKR